MQTSLLLTHILCIFAVSEQKGRKKRQLFVNYEKGFNLNFLLNAPLALVLPSIVYWDRNRVGRSVDIFKEDDEFAEELDIQPTYTEELDKIMVYFSYLEIPKLGCQERLLCLMASNAEHFQPLSDIFFKEISQDNGPVKASKKNLMWRYLSAVKRGLVSSAEECVTRYPQCRIQGVEFFDPVALKTLRYMASRVHLKLI